jgi:hypothetical protein
VLPSKQFRAIKRGEMHLLIELTPDIMTSNLNLGHMVWQKLQTIAGMVTCMARYEMILIEHFVS